MHESIIQSIILIFEWQSTNRSTIMKHKIINQFSDLLTIIMNKNRWSINLQTYKNQPFTITEKRINHSEDNELFFNNPINSAYFVRDAFIFVQKHTQLTDTNPQISSSELVGNIESKWAKLPSFKSYPVEQTQRKQQVLEVFSLSSDIKNFTFRVRDILFRGTSNGRLLWNTIHTEPTTFAFYF